MFEGPQQLNLKKILYLLTFLAWYCCRPLGLNIKIRKKRPFENSLFSIVLLLTSF